MSSEMHALLLLRLLEVDVKRARLESYLLEVDDMVTALENVPEENAVHGHVQRAVAIERWLNQALAWRPS